jgi:hypothetical protein
MITRSAHPAWCESPNAPDDDTHTHTAAIGSVLLPGDITAEIVLAQMPRTTTPLLTLHVTGPARRISVDMTGVESWALAGVLIDASVAHRQAITDPGPPPMRDRSSTRGLDREPTWCQYQHAPADHTHVHTSAIGAVHLNHDVTVEASLTQEPGDATLPTLLVHICTASGNLSFNISGQQAWTLAGLFIDATVTHAKTAPRQGAVPDQQSVEEPALADVHPEVRTAMGTPLRRSERRPHGQYWLRRSFRCTPRASNQPGPGSGPRPDGDTGPA